MSDALLGRMARRLEELPIHSHAHEFWTAVTAILKNPMLSRNRALREQIERANDSILSNMSEGFEQGTDKAVAKYLFEAKGSLAEVLKRLHLEHRKGHVGTVEYENVRGLGEDLAKMLGGWIAYLARCDWKDRGRHRAE